MKKHLILTLMALTCACAPVGLTSCSTAPSARVVQVQTLKAVGASVDTSMKVLAELYRDGKITQEQWNKAADIHDRAFLPAYNLAVTAVQANLDSIASPDLINIATQLANAVLNFQKPTP